MANEFPEATARPRYKVTNLYDCDYLIDENSVVLLQANRPPTVADMEGVAKRFNQLNALRAAAEAALPLVEQLQKQLAATGSTIQYPAKVAAQLRAALHPQPEETK